MALETKYTVFARGLAGAVVELPALSEADALAQASTQRALGNTVSVVKTVKTVTDVIEPLIPPKKK